MLRAKLAAAGLGHLIEVTSCGTHGHEGWPADPRSVAAASRLGFDLAQHRGSRFHKTLFRDAALLLAMDESHARALREHVSADAHPKIRLYMDFAPSTVCEREVPDPYYSDDIEFDRVARLCYVGADAIVEHLLAQRAQGRPLEEALLS